VLVLITWLFVRAIVHTALKAVGWRCCTR